MLTEYFPCVKSTKSDRAIEVRCFRYDELVVATSNFHPSTFLGRGSHGSVFRANLENGLLLAAAKIIRTRTRHNHRQNHHLSPFNEIEILSTVRSSRLVNLLGYTPNHHIAVVEFMPNGSLHDHLHRKSLPPSYPCRIRYALQVAEAVSALHQLLPPLIHRDIKPSNVLIDGKGKARLGDFGLAVRINRYRSPPPAGTMGYLDPGYVKADDVSTKTDVFSFGVLLLELITGRRPIDADYTPHSMIDWAAKVSVAGEFGELCDTRVASPEGEVRSVMIGVVELAWRCIGSTAEERPEMVEVVTKLKAADRRLSSASRLGRFLNRMIRRYTISSRKVSDVAA